MIESILQDSDNNRTGRDHHRSHGLDADDNTIFANHDPASSESPNYGHNKDIIDGPGRSVESPSSDGKLEHLNDDTSGPSILSQAKNSITTAEMRSSNLEPGLQRDAENGLSYLTTSFSEGKFDDPDIYSNVKHFRRQREVFFIPEKAEGERMIQSKMAQSLKYPGTFVTDPSIESLHGRYRARQAFLYHASS